METTENNKLIAEFMGFKSETHNVAKDYHFDEFTKYERKYVFKKGNVKYINLKYHSSWDWLIPVIDRIYSNDAYSEYIETLGPFSDGLYINTKFIGVTWESVVEFINWYNLTNK